MKRWFTVALLLVLTGCNWRTKTTKTVYPMTGGHEFIITQTMSPGFLDPSIQRRISIRWATGTTETLPTTYNPTGEYVKDVLTIGTTLYVPAGRSLFYRPGTIESPAGHWSIWEISPSMALYGYLRQYAKEHGDTGITPTPYTDMKRVDPYEVDPSVVVTNEELHYDNTRYFISPNRNRGWWLPHLITSIETGSLQIVMTSSESIPSMPQRLVFSPTNNPGVVWGFNEPETRKRELQPAGGAYGSPAAGEPSAHP